jgi:hypothetical protein
MGSEALREQLRKAYSRLLTPLIRILIRYGVTATEATNLLRQAYVDAATSAEFRIPGKRISDTRVAILTGLTRTEVKKLRDDSGEADSTTNLSRIGRLIAAWNQDPDFAGPYGIPVAIRFETLRGSPAPSFTELVRRHSPDLSPRAMLDELLRTGLAHIDDDGLIRSSGRTYIPGKLDPAAIERLGRTVTRLAATLDFNNQVTDPNLRRYERTVTTDIGLTEAQYRQFNIYLRAKCQQLLETMDNWLATQEGRINAYSNPERILRKRILTGIGVYHFLDEDLSEELKELQASPLEEEDDAF